MDRNLSLRKKATGLSERLDVVEAAQEDFAKGQQQIVIGINQAFGEVNSQVNGLKEIVDALAGEIGLDVVQARIEANRLAQMKEQADKTKSNIQQALKEGKLVSVDKIDDKTLIVGRETRADGTEVPPGYAALAYGQVKKALQEKLVGQAVGFQLETESGGKFEVLELYHEVEQKQPAAPTATPAATEAAAQTPPEAPLATAPAEQG